MLDRPSDKELQAFSIMCRSPEWLVAKQYLSKQLENSDVKCRQLDGSQLHRSQGCSLTISAFLTYVEQAKEILHKREKSHF